MSRAAAARLGGSWTFGPLQGTKPQGEVDDFEEFSETLHKIEDAVVEEFHQDTEMLDQLLSNIIEQPQLTSSPSPGSSRLLRASSSISALLDSSRLSHSRLSKGGYQYRPPRSPRKRGSSMQGASAGDIQQAMTFVLEGAKVRMFPTGDSGDSGDSGCEILGVRQTGKRPTPNPVFLRFLAVGVVEWQLLQKIRKGRGKRQAEADAAALPPPPEESAEAESPQSIESQHEKLEATPATSKADLASVVQSAATNERPINASASLAAGGNDRSSNNDLPSGALFLRSRTGSSAVSSSANSMVSSAVVSSAVVSSAVVSSIAVPSAAVSSAAVSYALNTPGGGSQFGQLGERQPRADGMPIDANPNPNPNPNPSHNPDLLAQQLVLDVLELPLARLVRGDN